MNIPEQILKNCAHLSSNIYIDGFDTFEQSAQRFDIEYGEVGHIRYAVLHEKDDCISYIVVRGTQNFKNVITDVRFLKRNYHLTIKRNKVIHTQNIQFHGGFLRSAEKILHQMTVMHTHSMSNRNYIVTGHSLGGSIAAILALLLMERGKTVDYVVTFGQPKIAYKQDCEFLQWCMGHKYLRVVNEFDIVPNLMTGFWLLWPYTHFGNEYRVYDSRTGNYIEHPKSQKLHSFFKQLFKEKVTDHHMDHYIRNLNL